MSARQIENLIKVGTVFEADPKSNRLRIQHGGLVTDWLPYLVPAAGAVSVWRFPSVGEICVILSPSGEPENGIVLLGAASADFPAPSSSPDETVVKFPDGAELKYNHAAGAAALTGIKTLTVEAAAEVQIQAPQTTVSGKLDVSGLLSYHGGLSGSGGGGASAVISGNVVVQGGSVTADGIDLKTHTHPGDSGGSTGVAR